MSTKFLLSVSLVFACFILCLCNPPEETEEQPNNSEKQFMYLRLSLLLSSTVRKAFTCRQNPKSLIINKFHPVGAELHRRGTEGIDIPTLDEVKDELLIYWPDITQKGGTFDYRHFQEIYKKDGKLCDKTLKGKNYFLKAIELTKLHRQNIYEAFTLFGTPPSESAAYNAADIRKAIRGYTSKESHITCYDHQGIIFLYEIMVCFDESGEFVNCNHEAPVKDCKHYNDIIIIPPLDE